MSRFQQDAALLLDAIGGKDNINAITHCVTRLRFVLKDPKRADVSRIESVASVKGTFTQSGQFQVIIDYIGQFCQVRSTGIAFLVLGRVVQNISFFSPLNGKNF